VINSPPGKLPVAEWRLEALGKGSLHPSTSSSSYYYSKQSDTNKQPEPDSWTVKLTQTGFDRVWARVDMTVKGHIYHGMNPEYGTLRSLTVLPRCPSPSTVAVAYNQYFTGYIPMKQLPYFRDGDDLIIHCHIYVHQLEKPKHTIYPATADHVIQAPKFDLSKIMDGARQNGQCTDITLVTEDKEFKAHKVVLVSQSPFFATRFEERWTEQSGNRIDMTDLPTDIMEAILAYMYTGNVVNVAQIAHKLLPKAEEYQLEGLKVSCEEALSKTLTVQSVIDVLLLADIHNAQNLKRCCLVFIAKNISAVKKTSKWSKGSINSGTNKNLWLEVLEFHMKST
jgi:speckle-type POZ protein